MQLDQLQQGLQHAFFTDRFLGGALSKDRHVDPAPPRRRHGPLYVALCDQEGRPEGQPQRTPCA